MPHVVEILQQGGLRLDREIGCPEWGRGNLRIFQNADRRRYVLKAMGHSAMLKLPQHRLNELIEALYACTSRLLLPIRAGSTYVVEVSGEPCMLFPWIGAAKSAEPCSSLPISEHVIFLAKLDDELARLPGHLVESLVDHACRIRSSSDHLEKSLDSCRGLIDEPVEQQFRRMCRLWAARPVRFSRFTKLAHTDLHTSNIMRGRDERLIAIDIDNMRMGDEFADLVYVLAGRGVDSPTLSKLVSLYRKNRQQSLPAFDTDAVYLGATLCLAWLTGISQRVASVLGRDMSERLAPADWNSLVHAVTKVNFRLGDALNEGVPKMNRGLSSIFRHALNEIR